MKSQVDALFTSAGFIKAGGMWGNAQWKQLAPGLVASVGGEYESEAEDKVSDDNLEGMSAPESEARRCVIFVYSGPFMDGWAIEHGECPTENGENCHRMVVANVELALLTIEAIQKVGGLVSFASAAEARAFLADRGPF